MKWLAMAWRALWRDARAGELRLLWVAVSLGVAALTSVGFLADRIEGGLQRDARQLLGGDAVLSSDHPLTPDVMAKVNSLGLQSVATLSFPTMARTTTQQGGSSRLVALKAVAPGYPMRGRLQILPPLDQAVPKPALATELNNGTPYDRPGVVTQDIPQAGQVWAEPALLEALEIKVGDDILLGERTLRISEVLMSEPDRGAGFMNFAPRIMMNQADLAATELIQPASRLNWRLAVVGTPAQLSAFTQWAESYVKQPDVHGVRLETLEAGRPEMRQTLDRAEKFLHLVALLAALLSAVAVALAARGFAARHLDDCAMLRVLGQSQRDILAVYVIEFFTVGLLASLLGLAMGFGLHQVFVSLLSGLVDTDLPAPGWQPFWQGLGAGLTLLFAFGLPPILQLARVPALRVIRRDLGPVQAASVGVFALGLVGFAALLLSASRDLWLGLMVIGGFAGAALVFAGMAWLSVWALRQSVGMAHVPTWLRMATRQISARPGYTVVQVSALSVGLLALMLLVLLRTDLVDSWRKATPADAPNRFVINIQPDQSQPFLDHLKDAGVSTLDWYPMIRGRLIEINGQAVRAESYTDDRAKRLIEREFNISHSAQAPAHNQIVQGKWVPNETQVISMEEGIAKTLKLNMGDQLRFEIAGQMVDVRISSLRRVDWTSMRANFFAIFPVAQFPDVPMTYIAAYRAPEVAGFDNQLVNRFPNVTNVDMGATINQVQKVLGQVIGAVEFLFGFTLAAGLVVLFAAVSATREERAREYAVLRALGAGNQLLSQVQTAELLGVGALSGALAAVVAMALGWGLAHFVFEFAWQASPWVMVIGVMAGAGLAWAAGWWGLREVLQRPVVQTLRQAAH
jgi:putative ABC transport system permease protein